VLALALELFGVEPRAWLLGIRGYEFNEFEEALSPAARVNLAGALGFVTETLRTGIFRETPAVAPRGPATVATSKGEI
jgi:hypothetical protein